MSFFGIKKKPKKSSQQSLFLSKPFIDASLVSGNIENIVLLPDYLKQYENEWISCNIYDFFTNINLLYTSVSEFCTTKECPVMSANGTEYPWVDGQKKSLKVSAPVYMDYMLTSIEQQLADESLFPTKNDSEFPKDFNTIVKNIVKHFFRFFAHVYHCHYDKILHLQEEAHLNTVFCHFIAFAKAFELLDKKELAPLQELIDYYSKQPFKQ